MADRNVTDQASSASWASRTARHTRRTVAPYVATTLSNGCSPVSIAVRRPIVVEVRPGEDVGRSAAAVHGLRRWTDQAIGPDRRRPRRAGREGLATRSPG